MHSTVKGSFAIVLEMYRECLGPKGVRGGVQITLRLQDGDMVGVWKGHESRWWRYMVFQSALLA